MAEQRSAPEATAGRPLLPDRDSQAIPAVMAGSRAVYGAQVRGRIEVRAGHKRRLAESGATPSDLAQRSPEVDPFPGALSGLAGETSDLPPRFDHPVRDGQLMDEPTKSQLDSVVPQTPGPNPLA
jgi:hypothetical protein